MKGKSSWRCLVLGHIVRVEPYEHHLSLEFPTWRYVCIRPGCEQVSASKECTTPVKPGVPLKDKRWPLGFSCAQSTVHSGNENRTDTANCTPVSAPEAARQRRSAVASKPAPPPGNNSFARIPLPGNN